MDKAKRFALDGCYVLSIARSELRSLAGKSLEEAQKAATKLTRDQVEKELTWCG